MADDALPVPIAFLGELLAEGLEVPSYRTAFGQVHFVNRPALVARSLDEGRLVRTDLVKMVLGRGLLSSDGEHWRSQRRRMQPEFSRLKSEAFASLVTASTERLVSSWEEQARTAQEFDLAPVMTELTLEVIVAALFSVDLTERDNELGEAITILMEGLGERAGLTFNIPMHFSPTDKCRFEEALDVVNCFCQRIIDERRQLVNGPGPVPQDLLTLLMDPQGGAPLGDEDLRDEVVTMLISGHETTALILSWSWAMLHSNPSVLEELHRELAQVLGGRTPTLGDVARLGVTQRVLMESMRLFPPVWFIARRATEDLELDDLSVKEGETVLICTYLLHRRPDVWPDPESFDPNRFHQEAVAARPRGTYLPFGGGRHTCLGQHLAMIEGVLMLATLAQRFDVEVLDPDAIRMQTAITLRQENGVRVRLRMRQPQGELLEA